MKKTLLSVLAGLMIVGSATALPGPEDRKAECEKKSRNIWVEKTQACIPINPCKSKDNAIKDTYCVTVFKNLELPWTSAGEWLAEAYIKNVLHTTGVFKDKLAPFYDVGLQDYMDYELSDGGYVVFEFDDLIDNAFSGTSSHPAGFGGDLKRYRAENAITGAFLAFGYPNGGGISDDVLCGKIEELASDVFSVTYNGVFEHEIRDGSCKIRLVNVIGH